MPKSPNRFFSKDGEIGLLHPQIPGEVLSEIAESIVTGHTTRVRQKTAAQKPAHPPPKPSRPSGPKATDTILSRRRTRDCARCLRRHGMVLTDRLEGMARPTRRRVVYLWRDYRDSLPARTVNRIKDMLNANEPFSAEHAYGFFKTVKKGKRKQRQKNFMALCVSCDRRYMWARRASVAFARGIQQRLTRPGTYNLADGQKRLSDIILQEMCGYMHERPPSRFSKNRKAQFLIEMADKVAVWIDEILSESDDRMLMMDFDEDDEVTGMYDGFTDEFLNMMAGGQGVILIPPKPAYLKFKGEMADVFKILTDEMYKKGTVSLISYGKFNQNYKEAADELRQTHSLEAKNYSTQISEQVSKDLTALVKDVTPPPIMACMKDMIDICSNYLAQNAEQNKSKGAAFKFLLKKMKQKPGEGLIRKGKVVKNMGQAAQMLIEAKSLEADHDDPNLSQEIYSKLDKLVASCIPYDLKNDMGATLDECSKYLSQATMDLNERGPAFDLLVKELVKHGGDLFTPEYKDLPTKYDAAHALKSAPGLSVESPDTVVSKKFQQKLHAGIDGVTPRNLQKDMNGVIERSANYLADYVRYRGVAKDILTKALRKEPNKELIQRKSFKMTQGEAANEIDAAPVVNPVLPVTDISNEIRSKMTKAVDATTPAVPPAVKTAMKALIKDAADQLSQNVSLKSGAAGDRYGHNLVAAVTKSMGDKELVKYKDFTQTYVGGGDELQMAGCSLKVPKDPLSMALQKEISDELRTTMPARMSPAVTSALSGDTDKASKHLAVTTKDKGDAVDYLVANMKLKGHENLGRLQGYMQTYADAAERVENAATLATEKVDKASYETANSKLKQLDAEKPNAALEKVMPEVIEDVAKFLGAPPPDTPVEKKRLLGEFLGKKGNAQAILAEEGMYKMTFMDAAKYVADSPAGITKCHDDRKKKVIEKKLADAVPDERLKEFLREPTSEAAAYLTDTVAGRGAALQAIHDSMQKEGNKKFLDVGRSQKTYQQAAEMIQNANSFTAERAPPGVAAKAEKLIREMNAIAATPLGQVHMDDTANIVAKYIAGEMAKEAGMVPGKIGADQRLAASVIVPAKPGGGIGPGGETEYQREARLEAERILGRPETEDERKRRLDIEKRLGRPETPEELRARLESEKRLGRPETEEEFKKRVAEQDLKKYGVETEAQKRARQTAERILGRPETDEERKRRLEAEKRLGRPETPEEMRARMEAEKRLGRPETEEEFRKRISEQSKGGKGAFGSGGTGSETEFQRKARLEAERILGRPETEEERKRRLDIEKRLGRPETPEELRTRLEAEKRLGRPETDEEFKKRMAEQDLKKYGVETEAQKRARQNAERILGRPETDEERKRRQDAEKRLGRPETPEEMRARMEAEKRLGRAETEEEFIKRIAEQSKRGKRALSVGSGGTGSETEFQRRARIEAARILGRPETEEERKRRLEIEKRLGRPETPEELRARLEAEKRLGRPETEEEFNSRMAEQDLKKYRAETEAQKQARQNAERILGRPETDEERKRRLEAEKRLGRPETSDEMRARMEAEKRLGRPETEEEFRKRISEQSKGGKGAFGSGGTGSETEFQRKARLEAERILGRPETEEERKRRLDIEKRLGRPETPEELRARLEAEKRLGRPETDEEFKKRMAEQDLKKYGVETEAQKRARQNAERILGRPETDEERKRRQDAEKRLGRPETPEEMRARMEAEKRLGRAETEEEFRKRVAEQAKVGKGAFGGTGSETEFQRKSRLEAERILGRPETEDERKRRLDIEKRLGRPETPEELRARLEAEKRLGRPETEEEFKNRVAEQDLKKYGVETEAQKRARQTAERILGRPETDEERKRRLEAEKKLGRPETPEEMRARMEAEKRLGRAETEEEFIKRIAEQSNGGKGASGSGVPGSETEFQRKARLEAERILGRAETEDERKRRLDIEKRLGRPETPEELRARLEAEKILGRPETEEEFKKRMAEQDLKKYGVETEAQKRARQNAERILGRLETDDERKRRLEVEKRLGRPETPEEMRARMEAEKRLGRPETEEEFKTRMAGGGLAGQKGTSKGGLPGETDSEKATRLAAEKILGRPETPEERRRRLSIERKLGRPETEAEYRARIAAERLLGRPETEAERQARLEVEARLGRPETEEEYRKRMGSEIGSGGYVVYDPEREAAMQVLHRQLKSKGNEVFYEQPKTKLTHAEASEWLNKSPIRVDRVVKESGDTARLTKKFERKLGLLMEKATPNHMQDVMQDVIVDSARRLSEFFVAKNYNALVAEALIAEMQKRGNEILIETNGVVETNFFAAQRLKMAKSLEAKEPDVDLAYNITENLTGVVRCCTMPRKLTSTMKEHVKVAADYLSEHVTKPEPIIAAYVALLQEMEAAGDRLVLDVMIKKSFKDAAAYLRQLTTFEDQIRRPNPNIQSQAENNLKSIMSNVAFSGYSSSHIYSVITESARLLTSYIMLQVEKTEALKVMIVQMDNEGDNVLLRHGSVRKTYIEGADTMRGKNTDQLAVVGADAVAARKIQIKLKRLMSEKTPDKFQFLMDDVIEDAMTYLAVALLKPQTIKVCKCMKSVFVQCELWCEEILRRVARPCCTCSRHVSAQALADLAPASRLRISPGQSHAFATGLDIEVKQCPAMQRAGPSASCPAVHPCPGLTRAAAWRSTTSYMLYATTLDRDAYHDASSRHDAPTRLPRRSCSEVVPDCSCSAPLAASSHQANTISMTGGAWRRERDQPSIKSIPEVDGDTTNLESTNTTKSAMFGHTATVMYATVHTELPESNQSIYAIQTASQRSSSLSVTSDTPTFSTFNLPAEDMPSTSRSCPKRLFRPPRERSCRSTRLPMVSQDSKSSIQSNKTITESFHRCTPHMPSMSTDQMSDWHSMLVSLMWNVQAWCDWMQGVVNRALSPVTPADHEWAAFQRKTIAEAIQWQQYNTFTRHLQLRLAFRYRDKRIVSPVRGTEKTDTYVSCQRQMLEIIEMFSSWTRWLMLIIKDTESIKKPVDSDVSLTQLRWNHFKTKVERDADDWAQYSKQLKFFWDRKYNNMLPEWLPGQAPGGPVWVVSACGAVPSGAVVAGQHHQEIIYVARTTHKSEVMPAALIPSKQCCLVYAEGAVHHYTKYQVMCNANVSWVRWRGRIEDSGMSARAVRVSGGVHVGRVRYRGAHLVGAVRGPAHRCHVVILGRAFAFNCYDLLVLADEHAQNFNTDPEP